MSLLRFLGLGGSPDAAAESETETVRRIAARLERLEPETAKYLATFAYVLARVANADLQIDEEETREMQRRVASVVSLSPEETALVIEIAKSQARLLGGTENYTVTREFRRIASLEQRRELLFCLFAVAAADGSISATENAEINAIGDELGMDRQELAALRASWRDKLGVLQDLPKS